MVKRWERAWLVLVFLCLALAGCMTPVHLMHPASSHEFSRQGRFALTVIPMTNDGQPKAVQGGFTWQDDGRHYRLDVTNPLGSTQARVTGTPESAVLEKADGTLLRAGGPDALLAQVLGSDVPVSGLRAWLRGRLPGTPVALRVQRDGLRRPLQFEQGGWRARLSRYDTLGPQVLVLERQEQDTRVVLRLVVNVR